MSRRAVLTDAQWERIAPSLPPDAGKPGRRVRVLRRGGRVRPARERAERHRAVAAVLGLRRPGEVPAVVGDVREVLERRPAGPGLRQRARRALPVRRRQRAPARRRRHRGRAGGRVAAANALQVSLLVAAVSVGVLDHGGAVGGGRALHLDGLAAVVADQLGVAVDLLEAELLVERVGVGQLDGRGAVGRRPAADVENLARQHRREPVEAVTGVNEPPLLLGAVVARLLRDAGTVAGGPRVHVERLAAGAVDQHVRRRRVDARRGSRGSRGVVAIATPLAATTPSATTIADQWRGAFTQVVPTCSSPLSDGGLHAGVVPTSSSPMTVLR